MQNTETDTDTAQDLALGVEGELANSLRVLDERLARVQDNLDLGCSNLHDLVSSADPEISRQLDVLGESISDLGRSLTLVRESLTSALGDTKELNETLPSDGRGHGAEGGEGPGGGDRAEDPRAAQRRKHDEPVTLGGILRALLMADEPGQRK